MTSPSMMRRIRATERILQQHMNSYGYKLIDVPMMAQADIFLTRAGHSIIEELFTFERFGQLMALRPEFTAAVAHRYIEAQHQQTVRWQLSGSIFIDEPSDFSRQYEQHNIGAELIGSASPMADAEMIAMAAQGVQQVGIENWQIVIGHVGLQSYLLSRFALDRRTYRLLLTQRERLKTDGKEAVIAYLADVLTMTEATGTEPSGSENTQQMLDVLLDSTRYGTTMGGRDRRDIAARLLQKRHRGLEQQQISDALDFLLAWGALSGSVSETLPQVAAMIDADDTTGQALLAEWETILSYLEAYHIPTERITLQPDLTKNWDYYTGIVFGIRSDGQYIASGGRYDGLTQLLGSDEAFPSVGFAYFTDKLLDLTSEESEINTTRTISGNDAMAVIQWATRLRQSGVAVEITDETADIQIVDDAAQYNNLTYTLDDLIQEFIP